MTELARLLGSEVRCANGRVAAIDTRLAAVERGALRGVGDAALALGLGRRLLVVSDSDTDPVAGAETRERLAAAGFEVVAQVFGHHPVAAPPAVEETAERLAACDAVVSVGSGTLTDIAKSAASSQGKAQLAVGTALSMNGYTSAISALLVDGVKRTLPIRPPIGVILDLDVCAAAPRSLTLAGLGDMLSKPFSEADWRLAHHVTGEDWFPEPGGLLTGAFERMVDAAPAIGRAEPEALRALGEAVLLSGLSMSVAGASSPASGAEHLISHYWDMMCYATGRELYGLHGTQVGIACCLVEALHHRVAGALSAHGRVAGQPLIDVEARVAAAAPSREALAERVRARHDRLPVAVREAVVAEALKKWLPADALRARLEAVVARREAIVAAVTSALLPLGAIRAALDAAGGLTRPEQLAPELAGGLETWAIARDIRARFTVFDLAADLGWL